MSNWANQMTQHVKESHALRVATHHGTKKRTAQELMSFDVVISSYGTLASDKKTRGPLLSCSWRRVILDEGVRISSNPPPDTLDLYWTGFWLTTKVKHNIRNAKAQLSVAACELKAESRWVLTGTPIVNTVNDLQSMVKFLKIRVIDDPQVFTTVITRPLSQGIRSAEVLLQALMQNICLRRTKDMAFVSNLCGLVPFRL